jgi:hypothetical protein
MVLISGQRTSQVMPLRIIWYNLVLRHWYNWRARRRWLADPNRSAVCFRAGAISRRALDWATQEAKKIEAERSTAEFKSGDEFRATLKRDRQP